MHTADKQPHLLWVTALLVEATPLIEHYQLKQQPQQSSTAIRVYQSEDVTLVVCGIGELAAVSATSFVLGALPQSTVAINIGIAGSNNNIGSIFYASSVSKQDANKQVDNSRKTMYPHLPFKTTIPGLSVITVDQPCTDYSPDSCYEMEAYGFCYAARQFIPAEQIHCLKIISDNPAAPVTNGSENTNLSLTKTGIRQLVFDNINPAVAFATQLLNSSQAGIPVSVQPQQILKACNEFTTRIENQLNIHLRFTMSQQDQLAKLIRRHTVLGEKLPFQLHIKTSSELIAALHTNIDKRLPVYSANEQSNTAINDS